MNYVCLQDKRGSAIWEGHSYAGLYYLEYTQKYNFKEIDTIKSYLSQVVDYNEGVSSVDVEKTLLSNTYTGTMNASQIFHNRSGHINTKFVSHALKRALGDKVKDLDLTPQFCESCVFTKAHRQVFQKKKTRKTTHPLQRVWFDCIGKIPVAGTDGERYVLMFVDEHTDYYDYALIKTRDQVMTEVQKYYDRAKLHWANKFDVQELGVGLRVATFCSDGAGEHRKNKLLDW